MEGAGDGGRVALAAHGDRARPLHVPAERHRLALRRQIQAEAGDQGWPGGGRRRRAGTGPGALRGGGRWRPPRLGDTRRGGGGGRGRLGARSFSAAAAAAAAGTDERRQLAPGSAEDPGQHGEQGDQPGAEHDEAPQPPGQAGEKGQDGLPDELRAGLGQGLGQGVLAARRGDGEREGLLGADEGGAFRLNVQAHGTLGARRDGDVLRAGGEAQRLRRVAGDEPEAGGSRAAVGDLDRVGGPAPGGLSRRGDGQLDPLDGAGHLQPGVRARHRLGPGGAWRGRHPEGVRPGGRPFRECAAAR